MVFGALWALCNGEDVTVSSDALTLIYFEYFILISGNVIQRPFGEDIWWCNPQGSKLVMLGLRVGSHTDLENETDHTQKVWLGADPPKEVWLQKNLETIQVSVS